jgi:glutamate synthase domain-containing protein 1
MWSSNVIIAPMCGIVGLFAKTTDAERRLGADLSAMFAQLADRGPDSAGVAVYRDPVASGAAKLSLLHRAGGTPDWPLLGTVIADRGDQAVVVVDREPADARAWIADAHPELLVLSVGSAIETAKRVGRPDLLIADTGLAAIAGTHALGHTRMATESRVSTEHSHPFSTGSDLCLVHNGSLSNHNSLRRDLRRRGIAFETDNDSEVAAGYLSWRLAEGDDLDAALHSALAALDGFFTFAVGTRDGFAVVRDPIACKPAILAETDDWVAMASEQRGIAVLPGARDAVFWEPEPARVYSWTREAVAA